MIQDELNFSRITKAIEYIQTHFKSQPNLDEIAEKVHLSPFHFQRLFKEWAGTSPKKFLQYISIEYAKKLLNQNSINSFDVAFETGLSGTSRLHDLFVTIEGMSPLEYKNGGKNLPISYSFEESPFGNILIASTPKGICHLAFADSNTEASKILHNQFPNASLSQATDEIQQSALSVFKMDWKNLSQIKLHLKGTGFQLKVWEALLKIPMGRLSTYGEIAKEIDNPDAARAVGSAIGNNPVAYLIPCHRVIRSSGIIGGYMWGSTRKAAMIGWEVARTINS